MHGILWQVGILRLIKSPWLRKPIKETLASCLDYLEGKGDQNKAEEFIELLRTENIFSPVAHNRLLTYIKGLKSQSDGLL